MINDQVSALDGKTKSAATLLKDQLQNDARILIIADQPTPAMHRSLHNLAQVLLASPARLNTLQVLNADHLIFTSSALQALEQRLTATKTK